MTQLSYGAVISSQVQLPEFFAKSDTSICPQHVQILQSDLPTRKKALEELLEASYRETQKWRYYYNISGVDFEKYTSFYVIGYGLCGNSLTLPKQLLDKFLGRHRWSWSRQLDRRLISHESTLKENLNPVALFKKLYPDVDIQTCLVTLAPHSKVPYGEYSEMYENLREVWRMYRLPFYIVGWSGDRFFILFSRYCNKRPDIMDAYKALLSKNNEPVNDKLDAPQYNTGKSDFYNYLSVHETKN